jgi:sulfite reductase alpha subunit-like flavoprotein
MPAGVKEALSFAVETHGGRTAVEAENYVDSMIREGRLMEECWS